MSNSTGSKHIRDELLNPDDRRGSPAMAISKKPKKSHDNDRGIPASFSGDWTPQMMLDPTLQSMIQEILDIPGDEPDAKRAEKVEMLMNNYLLAKQKQSPLPGGTQTAVSKAMKDKGGSAKNEKSASSFDGLLSRLQALASSASKYPAGANEAYRLLLKQAEEATLHEIIYQTAEDTLGDSLSVLLKAENARSLFSEQTIPASLGDALGNTTASQGDPARAESESSYESYRASLAASFVHSLQDIGFEGLNDPQTYAHLTDSQIKKQIRENIHASMSAWNIKTTTILPHAIVTFLKLSGSGFEQWRLVTTSQWLSSVITSTKDHLLRGFISEEAAGRCIDRALLEAESQPAKFYSNPIKDAKDLVQSYHDLRQENFEQDSRQRMTFASSRQPFTAGASAGNSRASTGSRTSGSQLTGVDTASIATPTSRAPTTNTSSP